jgi:pyruvate dehydrogenase E1 component beta subunit
MKGLLKASIRDPDPVVFLPNKQLFNVREQVPLDKDFLIPLGHAAVRREGSDVTVITYSGSVSPTLEAAEAVAGDGIDVEVIDLRTIVPLDWDAVEASVRKTGRAMVVHEAVRTGGVGAEIAARLHSDLFGLLKAPVSRVCGKDTHLPQNAYVDYLCHPQKDEIVEELKALVAFGPAVRAAS